MGIVTSSLPFSISDTIVEGDGTVLEGESVTASNLPARIELLSGERYLVGIGSRVTVEKNELVLEGGSVRVQEVTAARTPVSVRNIRFVPVANDAEFEVFMDSHEEASVTVHAGKVSIRREDGTQLQLISAGQATLIAKVGDRYVTDAERAPMEITRIQTRQVEELAKWEQASRRKGTNSKKLLAMLAGAAGGTAIAVASGGSAAAIPAANSAQSAANVLQTSAAVGNQINAEELDMGECGNNSCIETVPLVSNQFYYIYLGFGFGFAAPGFCITCP